MATRTRGSLLLGQPGNGLRKIGHHLANRTLGLTCLDALYGTLPPTTNTAEFLAAARRCLDLRCEIREHGADSIPAAGPLIVVCNHPFGGTDSLLLAEFLLTRRVDLRVLGNRELMRMPELAPVLLPVDVLSDAKRRMGNNICGVRNALRWLRAGGALLVFPAGEVASLRATGGVTDQRWDPVAGWLVRHSGACVVPACFEGRNPWWFHLAGLLTPTLRTALLPRVLLAHQHRRFTLHVGTRIANSRLERLGCDQLASDFLRTIALHLPRRQRATVPAIPSDRPAASPHTRPASTSVAAPAVHAALIEAVAPELLAAEIDALDPRELLLTERHFRVYLAPAVRIPCVLRELGRLRELTFRQVGEGTGKDCDLDRFDDHYLHLFTWDSAERRIVGAYRLGLGDEIIAMHSRRGLYTHSLFRYSDQLLTQLGPAIELGRAFVAPDYQKHFNSLLLLWRGITCFVSRNPQYGTLFGLVSISAEYAPASRRCLVRYLRRHAYDPGLARLVRARNPYRTWSHYDASDTVWKKVQSISDVDAFSRLLSLTEEHSLGVPLLLRQYLKLGGRVIGFTVDREFQSSLDTLMVVNLRVAPIELLARYMGDAEARQFLTWHESALAPPHHPQRIA